MARITTRSTGRPLALGATKADMEAIGQLLARQIVNRTLNGLDAAGRRFPPYSAAYARRKGVSPRDVDLWASGAMLRDVGVVHATARSVRIGCRSSAMADRARFNAQRGRAFLGVPGSWLTAARDLLARRTRRR